MIFLVEFKFIASFSSAIFKNGKNKGLRRIREKLILSAKCSKFIPVSQEMSVLL